MDTHDHTKYTAMKISTAGGYKNVSKSNEFARFVLPVKSEISRILWPHLFYNWIFFKQKRIFLETVLSQNGIGQELFIRQTVIICNWRVSESYSAIASTQTITEIF